MNLMKRNLRIFQHTNFLELKRLLLACCNIINQTIKKNIDIFASEPVLRVQALRSLEYHDQVARITNDIPRYTIYYESRIKVGTDTSYSSLHC